jgi:hypothetical protein
MLNQCGLCCKLAIGCLLLFVSCPGKQEQPEHSPDVAGLANQPLGSVAEMPAEEPEPANPRPDGENWVYTPQLRLRVGQTIPVEYRIENPRPGEAWIGLIPSAVESSEVSMNDAEVLARAYTVEAHEAVLNIVAPQAGRFRLRLFSSGGAEGQMLAESGEIVVTQWPQGDLASLTPPYLTINPVGVDKVEVQLGFPVPVYFEVPDDYPDKAWIGAIPVTVKSRLSGENDPHDVQYWFLDGRTKDSFVWMPQQEGTFVYRLFPSDEYGCEFSAESEEFTVIPKQH